jgi:hypothetical protein
MMKKVILACFFTIVFGINVVSVAQESEKEVPYFPKLGNYADLYLRGSYDILHMIRTRELEKVGQAAKIAAQWKLKGGRIVSRINTPNIMIGGSCASDVPGNPNNNPEPKGDWQWEMFKEPPLGVGDVLIVTNPHPIVEESHKRGCYVIGIGFPMTTNRYSPPNFNDYPDYHIEKMCDTFIYTWGPPEDGLITPELTPHLKILPTSPMTVVAYWLIMAQIANNLAYQDTTGTYHAAQYYLDILMSRLRQFHARFIGDINDVGDVIAYRVLRGAKIYPWSGRDEFWCEASETAGGLMGVYPLDPDKLVPNDIVIIAVSDSTPVREIEMARRVREKGAFLIGIFPFEREDGFSTESLKGLCNLSLDNLSGDIYGVLSIPNYPYKIIPTTAMMNNFAFWAIVGSYVQSMERQGETPHFWMSNHVPGGKAYNDSVYVQFLHRGR